MKEERNVSLEEQYLRAWMKKKKKRSVISDERYLKASMKLTDFVHSVHSPQARAILPLRVLLRGRGNRFAASMEIPRCCCKWSGGYSQQGPEHGASQALYLKHKHSGKQREQSVRVIQSYKVRII